MVFKRKRAMQTDDDDDDDDDDEATFKTANFAIFAAMQPRFSHFLGAKNLQPYSSTNYQQK